MPDNQPNSKKRSVTESAVQLLENTHQNNAPKKKLKRFIDHSAWELKNSKIEQTLPETATAAVLAVMVANVYERSNDIISARDISDTIADFLPKFKIKASALQRTHLRKLAEKKIIINKPRSGYLLPRDFLEKTKQDIKMPVQRS